MIILRDGISRPAFDRGWNFGENPKYAMKDRPKQAKMRENQKIGKKSPKPLTNVKGGDNSRSETICKGAQAFCFATVSFRANAALKGLVNELLERVKNWRRSSNFFSVLYAGQRGFALPRFIWRRCFVFSSFYRVIILLYQV